MSQAPVSKGPFAHRSSRRVPSVARSANVRDPLARVAEWQTRQLQVLVSERAWGFKSPLAHDKSLAVQGISSCLRPGFYRSSTGCPIEPDVASPTWFGGSLIGTSYGSGLYHSVAGEMFARGTVVKAR